MGGTAKTIMEIHQGVERSRVYGRKSPVNKKCCPNIVHLTSLFSLLTLEHQGLLPALQSGGSKRARHPIMFPLTKMLLLSRVFGPRITTVQEHC